ncbi:hypothetical protein AB0C07_27775 [Actinoplanes missouriensis]|uniref:FitA-like ribbon-helix-helix domain-containing protein n=1 Tax=Actinoplanes missouriensis TaxID=1866 RepID=UPI0034069BAE
MAALSIRDLDDAVKDKLRLRAARNGRSMEAEIRGIARLPEGRRRQSLYQAADEIFAAFPRQVLPFDLASASAYADIIASREKQGNPISGFDAQIAAICRSQAASLATRNTRDFVDTGISLLDPWQPAN